MIVLLDIIDKGQLLSIYKCKLEILCYKIKVIKDPLTDSTNDPRILYRYLQIMLPVKFA